MPGPPIWLIGCGNMAGAMLEGWLAAGISPNRFRVIRPSATPVADGVAVSAELPNEAFGEAIVQLGFKPHMLADAGSAIAQLTNAETTIVSILAGVDLDTLHATFPDAGAIVRAMPNTPVALRKGVVGLIGREPDAPPALAVADLMRALGLAEWIADEDRFNALTALAGSGPAFLYRFIDALAAAGAAIGLDADQARRLALATVEGAAALAARADEDPGRLAERVASPGGSTRKGLDVLDRDDALQSLLAETLIAAKKRNQEMGEEAKG